MSKRLLWPLLSMFTLAIICTGDSNETRITISGQVVDDQSKGVAGVKVRARTYADLSEAITDNDGRFVLNVLEDRVKQLTVVADDAVGDRIGKFRAIWEAPPTADKPIEIKLAACRRLPVEVTDADGKPAANVRVGAVMDYSNMVSVVTDEQGAAVLRMPPDAELSSLYASKPHVGFDYRIVKTVRDEAHQAKWIDDPPVKFQLAPARTISIRLVDAELQPIKDTEISLWLLMKPDEPDSFNLSYAPDEFRVKTDDRGIAQFRGVPTWDVHSLPFWPSNENYTRERIVFDPQEHPTGEVTIQLDRLVPVSGRARFADGRGAPNIDVVIVGAGFQIDRFRESVTSDEQGNFLAQVAPNQLYMFVPQNKKWAAPAVDGLIVRPNDEVDPLEFELQAATRVFGQVTAGSDEKPVSGQRMSLSQQGRSLQDIENATLPNPENKRNWVQPRVYQSAVTDENGRYEFFVGPGKFQLSGPSQLEGQEFEVTDQSELQFDFKAPRPEQGRLIGRVVSGDPPLPVAEAILHGEYRAHIGQELRVRADDDGRFEAERYLHPTVLHASSPDGTLVGILEIEADQTEVTIPIGPTASATARLLDAQNDQPLAETQVQWGRRVHRGDDSAAWSTMWGGREVTDSEGRFTMNGIVAGQVYDLSIPRGDGTYGSLPDFTVESAEPHDLGDLKLKPQYKPPTFEERMDRVFAYDDPAATRFQKGLEQAKRLRQHVLIVVVDRQAELAESWLRLRLEDRQVRRELYNYQVIHLDLKSPGAVSFATEIGVKLDSDVLPIWFLADASGEELLAGPIPRAGDNEIDKAAVLESLSANAPEPLDARELLEQALANATESNRRVIVQETATWCGPCHKLADFLERHRNVWDKDYIWIRIDERWRGAEDVMNGIKEGYRGGIPWCAILDTQQNVLATSDGPDGNIGFPSEPAGIDHFINMLESTKQRMSDQDLNSLRVALTSP